MKGYLRLKNKFSKQTIILLHILPSFRFNKLLEVTLVCFALKEEAAPFRKIRHGFHGLTQIFNSLKFV